MVLGLDFSMLNSTLYRLGIDLPYSKNEKNKTQALVKLLALLTEKRFDTEYQNHNQYKVVDAHEVMEGIKFFLLVL